MSDAFIIDGIRTPIGKYGGAMSSVRADDLAAMPLKAIMNHHPELSPGEIDEVILGCANQAGEDNRNVARMASLLAGFPETVPAETVNILCASGMSAIVHAGNKIKLGDGDLYIAGGIEHMTRAPYVMPKPSKLFSRFPEVYDTSIGWRFVNPALKEKYGAESMGQTAENVAMQFNVSREDQDKFAFWSQQKTAAAQKKGRLSKEIMPIEIQSGKEKVVVKNDEFPRNDTTVEKLAALPPAFTKDETGTVTAGNSSGINDGAAALIIASENIVAKHKYKPLAKIVASAVVGVEPRIMGIGPLPATQAVLKKTGLSLDQMDIIELNEAFASQSLATMRGLGLRDDEPRLNVNGGAISLGHPLGMSGARLVLTAAIELQERKLRYALCTMCIGVGQGMAMIIERT